MAILFEINGNNVVPFEETLLVPVFSDIWNRDKSSDKVLALKEFAYIEFFGSILGTNPYSELSLVEEDNGLSVKHNAIIRDLFHDYPDWFPDELVKLGVSKLEYFQQNASISYSHYLGAKNAIDKLTNFFNTFDLGERTKGGTLVIKPTEITRSIENIDKNILSLESLKDKILGDVDSSLKSKSGKSISPFADPSFK